MLLRYQGEQEKFRRNSNNKKKQSSS